MKIRILFVLSLVICLICGCEKNTAPVLVNLSSVSFSADITYYNEKYSCDCAIGETGDLTVNLTAPENLKDLSFVFSGESCKMMYSGMEVAGAEHFLPEVSSVTALKNVLKKCDGNECENDKRNLSVSGSVDGKKFTLTVSPTGLPISLKIPDLGMSVVFKNVTLT